MLQVYNKFCEVISLLSQLISIESLTDSIILKMSQVGISPFFVEHVNVLQLEALKVSRIVFRNYVKHRDLILDDILASLSRLPSSKRNLRSYRYTQCFSQYLNPFGQALYAGNTKGYHANGSIELFFYTRFNNNDC